MRQLPSPRPGIAALLCVMAAASTSTSAAVDAEAEAEMQCLVRQLRSADAATTVGELKRRCAALSGQVDTSGAPAADPGPSAAGERSLFGRRVISELRAMNEPFALLPHRPNFLLPLSYHRRTNGSGVAVGANDALETQFQISFKFPVSRPLFDGRLVPFFAYTGRAWWQVYDGANSRPFREYNHEPELMVAVPVSGVSLWGWEQRAAIFGFNHQSNGRTTEASRSWNRLFGELQFDRGVTNWASLRFWQRLKEDPKVSPSDSRGDDNPAITRYLGHFEARFGLVTASSHNLTLMARRSLRSNGKGAVQLDWSGPLPESPSLRWHVHAFDGYGDSLIDYDNRIRRIGLGVMLNDWF
jgi:phospholipase A1/A2